MGAPADRGMFVEQTSKRRTAAGPHQSDSSQFGMSGLVCQLHLGASSAVTLHLAPRPVNGYPTLGHEVNARDPVNLLGQALAYLNEAMMIIQTMQLTGRAGGAC